MAAAAWRRVKPVRMASCDAAYAHQASAAGGNGGKTQGHRKNVGVRRRRGVTGSASAKIAQHAAHICKRLFTCAAAYFGGKITIAGAFRGAAPSGFARGINMKRSTLSAATRIGGGGWAAKTAAGISISVAANGYRVMAAARAGGRRKTAKHRRKTAAACGVSAIARVLAAAGAAAREWREMAKRARNQAARQASKTRAAK